MLSAAASKPSANPAHTRARTQASIASLDARLAALPGDAALAAAFLAYAGPFPSEYREELVRGAWLPQVGGAGAVGPPAALRSGLRASAPHTMPPHTHTHSNP